MTSAGEHGENLGGWADEWRDASDDYLFASSNCAGSAQSNAASGRAESKTRSAARAAPVAGR